MSEGIGTLCDLVSSETGTEKQEPLPEAPGLEIQKYVSLAIRFFEDVLKTSDPKDLAISSKSD